MWSSLPKNIGKAAKFAEFNLTQNIVRFFEQIALIYDCNLIKI